MASTRLTWVPAHSILVVRDDKQVDAYEEYKRTGKAFKFTADEVKEINELNAMSLREPVDEGSEQTDVERQATDHAEVMSPGTDDAAVEGKKVAGRGKASAKDADL